MNKLFQLILSYVLVSVVFSSEIGVPVLLWQQKTGLPEIDSMLFDSKSTVNQIDGKVLADDYLKSSETIVAFIQNKLSLEQFTTEDEQRLTAVKSIFKDQSIKPTLLTDVLNPTEALSVKHLTPQKWDQIHVQNGDKVWIELPEESLAKNNELLTQLMSQIQKNVSKNTLFLITGRQNEFRSIDLESESSRKESDSSSPHKRVARDVSPVESTESKETSISNNKRLINFDDCLFVYTTLITISVTNLTDPKLPVIESQEIDLNSNDTFITVHNSLSRCFNGSETAGELVLTINNLNGTVNQTELDLNLIISTKGSNDYWRLDDNSTVTVKTSALNDTFNLIGKEISAEQSFGYSCSHLTIFSKPTNDSKESGETLQLSLSLRRFQIQPFLNPRNRGSDQRKIVFTESFDCEVWMTLPLWMGLLTLILMFIILSMGLYFIAIVNTPDRFENPKGKPLMINSVED